MQIVNNLTGDVEVQKVEQQILTFNAKVNDKCEITENIELDSTCEGVLGVNVNPYLKDVYVDNGKNKIAKVSKEKILQNLREILAYIGDGANYTAKYFY